MIINANALNIPLADNSVQCVVTSPPYWNLRNYGVVGQLGLEPTLDEYIANQVLVFSEVKRVLRNDGLLFINISDTRTENREWAGIPHRLLFALQKDGWRYEDEIVWNKLNPMPGSQTNRFTRSHEFIFMLNKSKDVYFDGYAVQEPAVNGDPTQPRGSKGVIGEVNGGRRKQDEVGKRQYTGFNDRWDSREEPLTMRNKRSVWTIATQPTSYAHFATFPEKLVEPCILAGTSEAGCCSAKVKKLRVKADLTPDQRVRVERFLKRKGLL